MSTYVIGDVQGCADTLARLVTRLDFDPAKDRIWLLGDLVNRGPDSLEVLRWAWRQRAAVDTVLGNHDLYLLARAAGVAHRPDDDTLDAVLGAPDAQVLLDWLAGRPLMAQAAGWACVHAGLLPQWTVEQALRLSDAASRWLVERREEALRIIYQKGPARWRDDLGPEEALRVSVRAMTRLRVCTPEGEVVRYHGPPEQAPPGAAPWYTIPHRASADQPIVFGHWARLGLYRGHGVVALDTGCVYGGRLTAMRLEDEAIFHQPRG